MRSIPTKPKARWRCKFNALVRARSLRRGGGSGGLGRASHSGRHPEAAAAGAHKAAILGGACEAVIAALYLDGGMDGGARASSSAIGRRLFAALGSRHARRQDACCRNGRRRARAAARRSIRWSARDGPDHAPRFVVEVQRRRAKRRRRARAAPSAKPNRTRRARLLASWDCRHDHALRLLPPSSARPMPASPRWSMRWWARRSPSSARRCRPRA